MTQTREQKLVGQRAWRKQNAEKIRGYSAAYREANREAIRAKGRSQCPEKVQRNRLKTRYGLSPESLKDMEQAQHSVCAVCEQLRPLVVDHAHASGAVRALLCAQCNVGLGAFEDDSEFLMRAAAYIRRFECSDLAASPERG